MPLTDALIRASKPQATSYRIPDEGGLYLFVTSKGSKLWRMRFVHAGKEGTLSLGRYPDLSLREARRKRDEARILLADGKSPAVEKARQATEAKRARQNTFQGIAEEFLEKLERDGLVERTVRKNRWLASLLYRDLGKRPITEIEPLEILTSIKKVERKGNYETAKRLCALTSRVFRYAIITGRTKTNPAAYIGEALVAPKTKHFAAILEPLKVGELLRAIDGFEGFITTKIALQLAPHVFLRPGELRQGEWSEIDFAARVWKIPAAKMKMRADHVVPLSHQAISLLEQIKRETGRGRYIFPSIRTPLRPMSENTINVALRRLGYTSEEMTAHGFRSTASTLLNESGKWSADAIERALAHQDSNKVRAAYHRGTHWDERVRMAQWWSDHLDALKSGGTVIPFVSRTVSFRQSHRWT